jgi:hypothetical protein
MQTLYPYESVRERDEEQSYRKFGNDPTKNIIHVPSLWVMNIGSTAIVTYGHEPLSVATRDAISIVEEDIRHLGKQDVTENMLTNIHVTNLDGSTFIYPIGTFRSYFQLESRIVDLNSVLQGDKGIQLTVESVNTWQDNLLFSYLETLNSITYERLIPSRETMYRYESVLIKACGEHISLVWED